MKRLLLLVFLFFIFSTSTIYAKVIKVVKTTDLVSNITYVGSTEVRSSFLPKEETTFLPNITTEEAKKAIIGSMFPKYWQVRNDSQYSLDLYRVRDDYGYSLRIYNNLGNELYKNNYSVAEQRVHFSFVEQNNGTAINYTVNVTMNPNSANEQSDYYQENLHNSINNILQELFFGHLTYNIKYSIKKDYVLISDTPLTLYDVSGRLGEKRKVVKINDKNVSEYKKADLKKLFNYCSNDRIKLEVNDSYGQRTVYLIRKVVVAPTYKQYL